MEILGITNLSKSDLNNKTKAELTKIVKFYKLNGYSKLNKDELVEFIVKFNQSRPGKKISSPKKSLTPKSPPKMTHEIIRVNSHYLGKLKLPR